MAVDPIISDTREPELPSALLSALAGASPRERSLLEEEVVETFLPLAARLARRYRHRGVDLEDLGQVANLALVKAARRYVPDRGEFGAFAAATISGEIKKHFRDLAWSVRPPRPIQNLQAAIAATTEDWVQSHGTEPTIRELARLVDDDERRIVEAQAAQGCFRATSLDAPVGDGGWSLAETIEDEGVDYSTIEELADLAPACRRLTADEKRLIALRFFGELTQQEIGDILGVSQMQVSRRLSKLLQKLRDEVEHRAVA